MIRTGPDDEPGIHGGLARSSAVPSDNNVPAAYVCSITVNNIDDAIKKIAAKGGRVHKAKTAIPGFGWYTRFIDTEGNHVEFFSRMDKFVKPSSRTDRVPLPPFLLDTVLDSD
jgi:predicted enzyme related to lactoylglutathione lyase